LSTSLRKKAIPENAILMYNQSGALPCGYSHECSLFGKHIVGIPTACTNPGSTTGSATHTHTTAPSHSSHTSSGVGSHNHTKTSNGPSATQSAAGSNQAGVGGSTHTNTITIACTSPTVSSVGSISTPADHGTGSNCPVGKTIRYIKNTNSSYSLRKTRLPINGIMIWNDTVATADINRFTHDACLNGKYLKGVPDACTSPNSTYGAGHTHGSRGAHAHAVNMNTHTHTVTSASSAQGAAAWNASGCGVCCLTKWCHTHSVGSTAVTTKVVSANSVSDGSHTHSSSNFELNRHDVLLLANNTINLRNNVIPKNGLLIWDCPLSCIPTGYGSADGTACTHNFLNRYPKAVATPCTNPSQNNDCNNHCHGSNGSHTHSPSLSHNHATSGTSGASQITVGICRADCIINTARGGHTHSTSGNTGSSNITLTLNSGGAHNHGNATNKPSSVEVAFIQKL
jgi:hypothetical protein